MSPKGRFSDPCVTQGVKKGLFRALRYAGSKKGVSFGPCVTQEAKKGSLSGPALRRKQKRVSFGPCVAQEAKKGSLSGPALRRKQKRGLFSALRYAGSKKGGLFRALRYARTQNLTPKALKRPASARAATNVERFSYPRPPPHDHSAPSGTVWGANAIRPYMYPANLAGIPDAPANFAAPAGAVRRRLIHRQADCQSLARRREGG